MPLRTVYGARDVERLRIERRLGRIEKWIFREAVNAWTWKTAQSEGRWVVKMLAFQVATGGEGFDMYRPKEIAALCRASRYAHRFAQPRITDQREKLARGMAALAMERGIRLTPSQAWLMVRPRQ